jgi:hypothetical protein
MIPIVQKANLMPQPPAKHLIAYQCPIPQSHPLRYYRLQIIAWRLFFEHRNYLAACFLFVPVIACLQKKVTRTIFVVVALGMALMLSGFSRNTSSVWQDFSSMVEASARKTPTSARAQAEYARDLFNANRYEDVLRIMDTAIATNPLEKPHLQLNRLMMLCRLGVLDASEFKRVASLLSNTLYDPRLTSIYSEFTTGVIEGNCPEVTLLALREMFSDMLAVRQNSDKQSVRFTQIKYFIGYVGLSNGEPGQAQKDFEESLRAIPNATLAMNMAGLMASAILTKHCMCRLSRCQQSKMIQGTVP